TLLVRVHLFRPSSVDDATDVGDRDVLLPEPEAHQEIEAGQRGGAGAGTGQLDLGDVLADEPQAIQDGGGDDDRGAVLGVVEHGDAHARMELALDVEALGRLDVLEIDTAEGGLEAGDDLDQTVGIGLGDLDVEDVDARELLEEAAFAFHDGLAGERADRAQTEDSGAVGDDG